MDRLSVLIIAQTPQAQDELAALVSCCVSLDLTSVVTADELHERLDEFGHVDVALREIGSEDATLPAWNTFPFVILLEPWDDSKAKELFEVGAAAVLARNASLRQIEVALHAATTNLFVVDKRFIAQLAHPEHTAASAEDRSTGAMNWSTEEHLTPRETEVLEMLAEGLSNKAIAAQLGISEHTVKAHVGAVMGKLAATSRGAAITAAIRKGWLMV